MPEILYTQRHDTPNRPPLVVGGPVVTSTLVTLELDHDPVTGAPLARAARTLDMACLHPGDTEPAARTETYPLQAALSEVYAAVAGTRLHRQRRAFNTAIDTASRPLPTMVLWADQTGHEATTRLAAGGVPPAVLAEHRDRIEEHLGPAATMDQTLPLLTGDHPDSVKVLDRYQIATTAPGVLEPWLGAGDVAQVAKALFGEHNYRKPLVRHLTRLPLQTTAFYARFADVVPIDHIIDAMARLADDTPIGQYLDAGHLDDLAPLLEALGPALASRLLRRPPAGTEIELRTAIDSVRSGELDLADVTESVNRIGQRRLRDAADVALMISRLPVSPAVLQRQQQQAQLEHELELSRQLAEVNSQRTAAGLSEVTWEQWLDDRTRAELTQDNHSTTVWCREMTTRLHGAAVGPCTIGIATGKRELTEWSEHMSNCIRSYAGQLGSTVLGGVFTPDQPDKPQLNFEIHPERGLVQILGPYNKSIDRTLGADAAAAVLQDLSELGVQMPQSIHGVPDSLHQKLLIDQTQY